MLELQIHQEFYILGKYIKVLSSLKGTIFYESDRKPWPFSPPCWMLANEYCVAFLENSE